MKVKLWKSISQARKGGYLPCAATVDELLKSFTGKCFVCGILEKECKQRLNMDHDHKTGKFRGWLCKKCNVALGLLDSSNEKIIALYKYLNELRV